MQQKSVFDVSLEPTRSLERYGSHEFGRHALLARRLLEQGATFLWRSGFAHYAIIPGIAVTWVVLGANLLGDGLRDRLDPRQRGRA